jgi:hypothetical protein
MMLQTLVGLGLVLLLAVDGRADETTPKTQGEKAERPPDVVVNEKDREAKAAVGQTIAVRVPEPALGLRVVDLKAEVEGMAVGRMYEVGDTVDHTKKEVIFDGLFKTLTFKAEKPGTSRLTITYERGSKKVERVIEIRVSEFKTKE